MRITPKNILQHELVGLPVRVVDSTCSNYKGLSGIVVGETYNMLKISHDLKAIKTVPKKECTFEFALDSRVKVRVKGEVILGRPEDRVKRRLKVGW